MPKNKSKHRNMNTSKFDKHEKEIENIKRFRALRKRCP